MASFDVAIPIVLKHEGGYSNLSSDKGGETYRGLTRKWNSDWNGWAIIDSKKPIKYNTIFPDLESKVKERYKKNYWDSGLERVKSQDIANIMFDAKVQHGAYASIVRRALGENIPYSSNLKVSSSDIDKINTLGDKFYNAFKDEREKYYRSLNQPANISGWLNRLNSFPDAVMEFAKGNKGWLFLFIICLLLIVLVVTLTTKKGGELLGVKKLILT